MNIQKFKESALKLHNTFSGRSDTVEDVIASMQGETLYEPLIHDNGIGGKLSSNGMIHVEEFYPLFD